MVRGRRNAKRDAALKRETEQRERDRMVAEASQHLTAGWGSERAALDRLGVLSRDFETLHRQETQLLDERDDLVVTLRRTGTNWAALAARTSLSRQALMKRL